MEIIYDKIDRIGNKGDLSKDHSIKGFLTVLNYCRRGDEVLNTLFQNFSTNDNTNPYFLGELEEITFSEFENSMIFKINSEAEIVNHDRYQAMRELYILMSDMIYPQMYKIAVENSYDLFEELKQSEDYEDLMFRTLHYSMIRKYIEGEDSSVNSFLANFNIYNETDDFRNSFWEFALTYIDNPLVTDLSKTDSNLGFFLHSKLRRTEEVTWEAPPNGLIRRIRKGSS